MDNTYNEYKWLDAEELKPQHKSSKEEAYSRLVEKALEDFINTE